ncbi:MAG: hypothetical protein KKD31_13140, partial [Bacteroidetes bacterium]|nr:hypothetical protein [Bacteroidota bacterium]
AQTQLQWEFPIVFIDADKVVDTIIFGYHPDAHYECHNLDTVFEYRTNIDNSAFNAYVWSAMDTVTDSTTSVRKIDISGDYFSVINVWFCTIRFLNGKFPMMMILNRDSLNSPNLPFPDISPYPKARVEILCGDWMYPCPLSGRIIVAGYPFPWPVDGSVIYSDTIIFESSFGPVEYNYLNLQIIRFNSPCPYAIEEFKNSRGITVATKSKNIFEVIVEDEDISEILVSSLHGERMLCIYPGSKSALIDLSYYPGGMYILKIVSSKQHVYHLKTIVQ